MNRPQELPEPVKLALDLWCQRVGRPSLAELLPQLQWDGVMGCYYFVLGEGPNRMFYGVELNGYIHT